MNGKNKNVKPSLSVTSRVSSIEHRAAKSIFRLLCSLFVFCFLTSFVSARTPSEQITSTDLLLPYLTKTLQDVNTPTIRMKNAKFSPIDFLLPYLAQTLQDVNTSPVHIRNVMVSPIDLLAPYLEETAQNENTSTIQIKDNKVGSISQEKPQTSDIVAVNVTKEVNQEFPGIDSAGPAKISTQHGRQLWRASMSLYQGERDNRGKFELKRLIEQIRSVEFKPPRLPEPSIAIEPVETKNESNEIPSEVEVKDNSRIETIESISQYKTVTNHTLQMLVNIAQDPNQLENPFELGEVLYVSGHLREAAVFYQEALNRIDAEKNGSAKNRPWTLFQLGNCLRDHDLPAAKKMYVKLITEHPESPWVGPAKAREKLIDWFLKDKPQTLITELLL